MKRFETVHENCPPFSFSVTDLSDFSVQEIWGTIKDLCHFEGEVTHFLLHKKI